MFNRVKADFQLTIVLLYGFFSAAIITPFAVYRFMSGKFNVGLLDASLVVIIGCMVAYGWRYGKTERTGKFLVVIGGIGALMSSEMLGVVGVFWMYVAIVANFFLTKNLRFATIFTISILILLAITGKSFDNGPQMWSFLATSSLISLLSYIIAKQYRVQHERLQYLATVDPLTGAYNRRQMEQEMHFAVEEFARTKVPMSLLLMDIDHFKNINDAHGHERGDSVLSAFAAMVMDCTRHVDRFFRYGGEEFMVLAKTAAADDAMVLAEKIRKSSEQTLSAPDGAITVSIGIAQILPGESCEQWMARADAALYAAKNSGRNRVCIAENSISIVKELH